MWLRTLNHKVAPPSLAPPDGGKLRKGAPNVMPPSAPFTRTMVFVGKLRMGYHDNMDWILLFESRENRMGGGTHVKPTSEALYGVLGTLGTLAILVLGTRDAM